MLWDAPAHEITTLCNYDVWDVKKIKNRGQGNKMNDGKQCSFCCLIKLLSGQSLQALLLFRMQNAPLQITNKEKFGDTLFEAVMYIMHCMFS